MAVGVKLLHLVSDNSFVKVVHRFVLSPFRTLPVSRSYFRTLKTNLLLTPVA